jgi:hypothetical protein
VDLQESEDDISEEDDNDKGETASLQKQFRYNEATFSTTTRLHGVHTEELE